MIEKNSIQSTTGTEDNVSQSFYQNIFYNSYASNIVPFEFDVPKYTTVGGTKNYYGQDPLAIFTNIVKPFIRFTFSANTVSFGSDVYIKHDIYRVSWDTFNTVQSGLKSDSNDTIQSDVVTTETIEEVDDSTGEIKIKTITSSKKEVKKSIKSSKKTDNKETSRNATSFSIPTITDIQNQLDTPVYSITATTTGITTSIYDFEIEQFVKNIGEHKTELFQNKDQYIIDTNFIFNVTTTPGLTDLLTNKNGRVFSEDYSSSVRSETNTGYKTIDRGEFNGLKFKNAEYFSYIEIPDKPMFEYPTPTGGTVDTFTPEIFWSNGEKADEYLVQVSYNTGDTTFSGDVFTYEVPKIDEFKKTSQNKTKGADSEFTASKELRTYQLSLKSNSSLIYRVGNVSVLTNMFGVKQKVVTFSENRSLYTQLTPIKTFVRTESDSPYLSDISLLEFPPSLESETPLSEYTLSGTVSGSTVTGATIQLIYPNSSSAEIVTNSIGEFSFSSLESGSYTLNTTYRGYATDSRSITINSDTSVFVELKILWGNSYDTWASKGNDIIKY